MVDARENLAIMAKANGEGTTVYNQRLFNIASIKQVEVIQDAPAKDKSQTLR